MVDNNALFNVKRKIRIEELENLAEQIKHNIYYRKKPLVVEFAGLPKSGKTTAVNSLSLFLRRNEIPNKVITERASVCPIKNKEHPYFNIWTGCTTIIHILEQMQYKENYVIIVDRGIYDAIIWMKLLKKQGKLEEKEFDVIRNFLFLPLWQKHVDLIINMHTTIENAMTREYKDLLTNKEGSIMNKNFLNLYLDVSNEVKQEYGTTFKKFIDIDTTDKQTIDGVAEITEVVLENLKQLSDEELVVIPKKDFVKYIDFVGFNTDANYLKFIEKITIENPLKMRRSEVEEKDDYIQLIPCAVIKYKNSVLFVTKREITLEKRFNDKQIVWVGGHLRWEDKDLSINENSFIDLVNITLRRELREELNLCDIDKPVFKGLVYDKTHYKSLRHLGIVFLIEIKDSLIMNSLNNEDFTEYSGQGMYAKFINLDDKTFFEKIRNVEPWSADILKELFQIDLPLNSKTDQQLFMF